MKKRTKIFILVAMVLLLGVTGYLNIALNNNVVDASTTTTSNLNYFDSYRNDRQTTRDQELAYYEAIIKSESSSAETIANAESKKLEIVAQMESELVMEGLIKAKGFADVIVTNSNSYINILVKSAELQKSEVAQIASVVMEQTGKDIDYIKVIPVS